MIFTILLVFACGSQITLSGEKLLERTRQWKDPRAAVWYYMGSSDRYDYFYFHDAGIDQKYRVPAGEIGLNQKFVLNSKRDEWVVMPWGPPGRNLPE